MKTNIFTIFILLVGPNLNGNYMAVMFVTFELILSKTVRFEMYYYMFDQNSYLY